MRGRIEKKIIEEVIQTLDQVPACGQPDRQYVRYLPEEEAAQQADCHELKFFGERQHALSFKRDKIQGAKSKYKASARVGSAKNNWASHP